MSSSEAGVSLLLPPPASASLRAAFSSLGSRESAVLVGCVYTGGDLLRARALYGGGAYSEDAVATVLYEGGSLRPCGSVEGPLEIWQ